jgi:hypothetical protein
MSQTNAGIIRKAYEDFAHGNIPAVFNVFDTAITWHVPGHGPLSGDFKGHDALAQALRDISRTTGCGEGGRIRPQPLPEQRALSSARVWPRELDFAALGGDRRTTSKRKTRLLAGHPSSRGQGFVGGGQQ